MGYINQTKFSKQNICNAEIVFLFTLTSLVRGAEFRGDLMMIDPNPFRTVAFFFMSYQVLFYLFM